MTTKFCTIADVKNYASVEPTWAEKDALLELSIKTATAQIREYTRRQWTLATYTQFLGENALNGMYEDARGYLEMYFDEYPVVASSVALKVNPGNGSWVDGDDYTDSVEVDAGKNKLIIYSGSNLGRPRAIRVTYEAGYPVNGSDTELLDVDATLSSACALQAAFTYRRTIDGDNNKSEKWKGGNFAKFTSKSSGLTSEVQALLKSRVRLFTGR